MPVLDIVAEGVETDFAAPRISLPARATAARYRRRCASSLSGAAWRAHRRQTPSVSSAVTEPASRAVVRLSRVPRAFARPARWQCRRRPRRSRRSAPRARRRPRSLGSVHCPAPIHPAYSLDALALRQAATSTAPEHDALCTVLHDRRADHGFAHLPPAEAGSAPSFARPRLIAWRLRDGARPGSAGLRSG